MGKGLWLGVLLAASLVCAPAQAEPAEEAAEPPPQVMPSLSLGTVAWLPADVFRNRMAPFLEYLERALPFSVRLVIIEDAHSFFEADTAGAFDLSYVDGCDAARAMAKGRARPLAEIEIGELRSLVIVKKSSDLNKVSDLVGLPILVPMDTHSLATRLGLLSIIAEQGKLSGSRFELRVAPDNGQVVFDVIEGRAEVGIVHDAAYAALAEPLQASLRILATSEPGPNAYLISRADLPPAIADQVREVWLSFEKDAAAAAYFTESSIQQFRAVDTARLASLGEFCARVETVTAPLVNPQHPPREGEEGPM